MGEQSSDFRMLKHPSLYVLGYSEAGMLLRQPETANVQAVLSIHGQHEHPLDAPGVSARLLLQFDDAESGNRGDSLDAARMRWRQRDAAEIGLTLNPPTVDHARSIIEFARSIQTLDGALLCQCAGGISRSPAAALLCLAAWTGPGHEDTCVERLLAIRPSAVPHAGLVEFGDQILGRGGALAAALCRARPY
jgi:predicted protein tyrosine phosphatase